MVLRMIITNIHLSKLLLWTAVELPVRVFSFVRFLPVKNASVLTACVCGVDKDSY